MQPHSILTHQIPFMLGWLSFIRSIKIFGISMQFIRSANELKMVHNEKYVEYYLKFQKKKLHQKCHWSLVSLVDYNIRLSCCVPEKNQFEKRQFPNRRQKFNRGIFLEYVWRMEYQSKVERKDKNNIECIWFSNAPSLVDFFLQFLVVKIASVVRLRYFHGTNTTQYIQNMIILLYDCAHFFHSVFWRSDLNYIYGNQTVPFGK